MEVETEANIGHYELVRGERFAHMTEPMVSFARGAFWVNVGCLKRSPETTYVHFLLFRPQRRLILKPCGEEERNAVRWCTPSLKPRKVLCDCDFFSELFTLMGWSQNNRHRLLGRVAHNSDWTGFAFDLTRAVVFPLAGVESDKNPEPATPPGVDNPFGGTWDEHCRNPLVNRFSKDTVIMVDEEEAL